MLDHFDDNPQSAVAIYSLSSQSRIPVRVFMTHNLPGMFLAQAQKNKNKCDLSCIDIQIHFHRIYSSKESLRLTPKWILGSSVPVKLCRHDFIVGKNENLNQMVRPRAVSSQNPVFEKWMNTNGVHFWNLINVFLMQVAFMQRQPEAM